MFGPSLELLMMLRHPLIGTHPAKAAVGLLSVAPSQR
jgi:hypothetical protein